MVRAYRLRFAVSGCVSLHGLWLMGAQLQQCRLQDPDVKTHFYLFIEGGLKLQPPGAMLTPFLPVAGPQSWARKFFHTLSHKKQGQVNPIYNLLPDILSNLTREAALLPGKFQTIMQVGHKTCSFVC